MKLDVTRDVINDLWPLYRAGEATPDSKTLVDAFLSEDEAFAAKLKKSEVLPGAMPGVRLSPDAERRLLDDARDRARLKLLLIGGGIGLAALIFLLALGGAFFIAVRGF